MTVAKIPFMDFSRREPELNAAIQAAMKKVASHGQFIEGPEVKQLEGELSKVLGKTVVTCASGSDALLLVLMHLGVRPGDEILTTPFTFVASASCALRLGATVRFADVDPRTYNLDPKSVTQRITAKTKAVIAVDLFGNSADYSALAASLKSKGIALIDDAAQSFGGSYREQPLGALGDYGCLSFFPAKNLGCFGDGGAVVVEGEQKAKELTVLKHHGSPDRYRYPTLGINSRLDTLQAAILSAQLPYVAGWVRSRQGNALRYNEAFEPLEKAGHLLRPSITTGSSHSYNQYVVRVPVGRRDALKDHLTTQGIGTMLYYPHALHTQEIFAGSKDACPQAEMLCSEVLALPVYPWLRPEEQSRIVETIAAFLKS